MKLKNLFKVMFALVCVWTLFLGCERPGVGSGTDGKDTIPSTGKDTIPETPDTPTVDPEAYIDSLLNNKPAYVETDQVYLLGNCKTSGMDNSIVVGYGDGERHTFGGATMLTKENLLKAGYYVVGVRVYIGAEVESGKVFIGTDYKKPEVAKEFTYKAGGWQYVLFDEPYDYKQDTYIGFEATGVTDFMALEKGKSSKTEMMCLDGYWDLVSNQLGRYVWSMQAIVVGGDYTAETQKDVVLERIKVSANPTEGDAISVSCELRGTGIIPAENMVVKCSVGGETTTVPVSDKLMNGQSVLVNFEGLTAPAIETAIETIKVEIEADYTEDENYYNNNSSATITVFTDEAFERNAILIEQFTGQDCPNCPAGAEALKVAIAGMQNPEKAVWVAHHTYYEDQFSLSESADIAYRLEANFAPACDIDRMPVEYMPGVSELIWHPGYSTTKLLEDLVKTPGLATIEMNRTFTMEDSTLTVEVKGRSLVDVANITVIVKQSGIAARQSGALGMYTHNNAPRAFLTASTGNKLELDADGNYTATYSYKIPAKVGGFECVFENMDIVAFVHGNITSSATRMVYNTIEMPVVEGQQKAAMRVVSLYRNNSSKKLRSLSEQICY